MTRQPNHNHLVRLRGPRTARRQRCHRNRRNYKQPLPSNTSSFRIFGKPCHPCICARCHCWWCGQFLRKVQTRGAGRGPVIVLVVSWLCVIYYTIV